MTGKRILLIGDFGRSSFGAPFYNTNFALHAGFIRAGCHVLTFSDRDVARETSVVGHKSLGRGAMNRALVTTAGTYRPHLVLFGHADMTAPDTFLAIREAVPGVRLAQFNVDALFRTETMARFRNRATLVDLSFITTAAPDRLRALGAPPQSIAYFPNPVDAAIAVRDLSQIERTDATYDGVFLGTGIERRDAQVRALNEALPADFRFHAGGGVLKTERLNGPAYLETLARGTLSPNLPLDDRLPVDFLYSSDRIAHLLAHGIVPFCPAASRLDSLYDDGVVLYTDLDDLASQMAALAEDDTRRRQIAANARRIGLARTGAERVARYMLDQALGNGPTTDYGWPADLI
ncbi:MAG: glycosyltransferase family 1 protein [Hyphomicrobiaceae bacterium]